MPKTRTHTTPPNEPHPPQRASNDRPRRPQVPVSTPPPPPQRDAAESEGASTSGAVTTNAHCRILLLALVPRNDTPHAVGIRRGPPGHSPLLPTPCHNLPNPPAPNIPAPPTLRGPTISILRCPVASQPPPPPPPYSLRPPSLDPPYSTSMYPSTPCANRFPALPVGCPPSSGSA